MFSVKIRRVEPLDCDIAKLADEIVALYVTNETVGVCKAHVQSIAKFGQQTVVVKLIHDKFGNLQNRATDRYRFTHLDFCLHVLDYSQLVINYSRELVCCL